MTFTAHRGTDRRRRPWRIALGVFALQLGMPTSVLADTTETFHYTVDGVAEVARSTCPFGDWTPTVATECEDWLALLYRSSPVRPQHHNRTPWRLELTRARVLVHPDGEAEVLWEAYGIAEDIDATFDERHLRFASVRAAVAMSDGSTRAVDLSWDGTSSPLETAGNNGPFNQANGIDRHYVDRCFTVNQHAHQTYRANVAAAGTIDGTSIEDIPHHARFDPFLGRGHFNVVVVRHGTCEERER